MPLVEWGELMEKNLISIFGTDMSCIRFSKRRGF